MVRPKLIPLIVCALVATPIAAQAGVGISTGNAGPSARGASWPVATSLRTTIDNWARRQGWPVPQFLTDADWPVDVPGSIPGSIEQALTVLVDGFGHAAVRPRIQLFANHVIVVSEIGADR